MTETCESCKHTTACGITKMGGFWCHIRKDWTHCGKWCTDYKKGKMISEEKSMGY